MHLKLGLDLEPMARVRRNVSLSNQTVMSSKIKNTTIIEHIIELCSDHTNLTFLLHLNTKGQA